MAIKDRKQDFEIFQGSTFARTVTWIMGGLPMDLTGIDLRMDVRPSYDASVPALALAIGNGITILDMAGGRFEIKITDIQTAGLAVPAVRAVNAFLPYQDFVYDLEYKTAAGDVDKLLWGKIRVLKEVTHG